MKSHTNKSDQNNYNAYVSQYLKKRRQSDNGIWSVHKS